MTVPPAPKFIVIDQFLADDFVDALTTYVASDPQTLVLQDLGGPPGEHYSAQRKVWIRPGSLGRFESAFGAAVLDRFSEILAGTGVPVFDVARIETEVCAQRQGSYFAKHIDTDTREPSGSLQSDRLISAVYYFPREPRSFIGGELVIYDFTGRQEAARVEPARNRLVAFPSFACHEVTAITDGADSLAGARWSVNCWLHRARQSSSHE
jgi:Rps23 Pro-64 3,4-dihydroxylase Tpa1-like proline 4-hydroxylase